MVRISRRFAPSVVDKVCRDNPPLECTVCFDELPVCVRWRMRVGVCGHVCACARACVGSISNKTLSGPLEASYRMSPGN